MKLQLEKYREIAFPCERVFKTNMMKVGKNNRKLMRNRLPPLENLASSSHSIYDETIHHRYNTFYRSPIGEENFSIKHIVLEQQPSSQPEELSVSLRPSMEENRRELEAIE